MSASDRREMLDRSDKTLSIRRQCALTGVARSGVYRPAKPANDNDLAHMRRLDELFTAWPFLGSRRMTEMLRAEGEEINRKRVQRLMRKMGIAALGPKPNTTKPAPGHKIFPYLLRNLKIDQPNHVWAEPAEAPAGYCLPDSRRRAPISRISPLDADSSISSRSSIGRAARFWPGASPIRWTRRSALPRSTTPWPGSANRRFSTRIVRG
jgi:putative transposase